MKTHNDRLTHAFEGPVVVFLIGMRVNRWWKVRQWLRTVRAMGRILPELHAHPELGMLGAEAWFGRTTLMVSYWKSQNHLFDYAKLRNAEHLPAWRAFNQHVGSNGDVGIWHETYVVESGAHESVYVNMPEFGLGRIGGLRAASHRPNLTARSQAAAAP